MHDFDRIIDRRNTNSIKYDFAAKRGIPESAMPMWVADMDFRSPKEVIDALAKVVEHGIFGYSEPGDDYYIAVCDWFREGFAFDVKPDWTVAAPGVVFALNMAIQAFTEHGDSVIIQSPVYYPFGHSVRDNGRRLIESSLALKEGKYEMDFDDFEEKVKKSGAKLFILCSPHNPVGRVWTEKELACVGDICMNYDVIVVSDEIHCDFAHPGHKHQIFGSIKDEFLARSITCTAPSKTFNLPGLHNANVFIADKNLRRKYENTIRATGLSQPNALGFVAGMAAYRHGRPWLYELKAYIQENLSFARDFIAKRIPSVKLIEPEGTYLIWLDFRELAKTDEEVENIVLRKAGLWLDLGGIFGKEGHGFARMNIACPKEIVRQALVKLEAAVSML
ncbi:MAG: pyridoxal phosphate-dependent aminotransferase [Clostridiales bacterium]|jgi:cystathionine beta-lyase|nr:pyridoxal phosphate-dependent aminotransferase [Clostridiales bacterium]